MIDYNNFTEEILPTEFKERIDRFDRLFLEGSGKSFRGDDLYVYEMGCIKQALSFWEYFRDTPEEEFKKIVSGVKYYDVVEEIKDKLPFFDEGHSGNSLSSSWGLFICYRERPELIPYMHGSLAGLIGDSGYYDNRIDIPKL